MDRRGFFRRLAGVKSLIRPPGAIGDEEFFAKCDGCGACVTSCPQEIVMIGDDGQASVRFSANGCVFCGRCADVCDRGAIVSTKNYSQHWPWQARITQNCLEAKGVMCRGCEASCEHESIRFRPALGGKSTVSIQSDICTGCGFCVSSCPVGAIEIFQPDGQLAKISETAA